MTAQDLFHLNQLRYEIAMRRSLQHWTKKPVVYGAECPHCSSKNYRKHSVENGTQRYRCHDCNRRFNERPKFTCRCKEPGKTPQCHNCPKFQAFVKILQEQADLLRNRTLEELEQIQVNLNDGAG